MRLIATGHRRQLLQAEAAPPREPRKGRQGRRRRRPRGALPRCKFIALPNTKQGRDLDGSGWKRSTDSGTGLRPLVLLHLHLWRGPCQARCQGSGSAVDARAREVDCWTEGEEEEKEKKSRVGTMLDGAWETTGVRGYQVIFPQLRECSRDSIW